VLRIDDQAFRTDTGRQRSANEDSLFTRPPLFVVADGMGGAQAGEVASKTAVESFDKELPKAPPELLLQETIEAANRTIHEHAREDPGLAGMGTTITATIVDLDAEEVAIGHVGDSRAYRLRGNKLERLTRDHSLVEEMRRKGQLTDAQAEDHPQRSIITRALGPEPEVEVDLQTVPAQAGDVFLICSDGLTTMLGDEQIARLLARATSMQSAVRALVDEATRAGGRDNITVIAFRLEDAGAPARAPEGATLIGPSAEEAGLTATEVRRRAAGEAAKQRREDLATANYARRPRPWRCWSCSAGSPSAPGTAIARSGSLAPTRPGGLPSTAACPTNCPSGSSSTTSATRARSRPGRCRAGATTRSPATTCARAGTRSP
jgi:serine/threonine protein phosphatase PrpC